MSKEHLYHISVKWTGNLGEGTKDYRSYGRDHFISGEGKSDLLCTADPQFRGDPTKWNPEEMLTASLSSCHMLSYLHLCAVNKIIVVEYIDNPIGKMELSADKSLGRFTSVLLRPKIKITDLGRKEEARKLHDAAHKLCFIANSVNFTIEVEPIFEQG